MLGVKYNKLCKNCSTSAHNNPNKYFNNNGGSSVLTKKAGSRFSRISSNSGFSINGVNNRNIHSLVGNSNPNTPNQTHCNLTSDKNVKTSVKNSSAYIKDKLRCHPSNSVKCYKEVNKDLVKKYDDAVANLSSNINDVDYCEKLAKAGFNKHFNVSLSKPASYVVDKRVSENTSCVNRENYENELKAKSTCNNNIDASNRISKLKARCNLVKDKNYINGFTPGYDIYYKDSSMFGKRKGLYNPPDYRSASGYVI